MLVGIGLVWAFKLPEPRQPDQARSTAVDVDPAVGLHDFASIISDGIPPEHTFRFANDADRPVRILEAITFKPCCSGLGPLPDAVPPGGELKIPVLVRTAGYSGPIDVRFLIRTDAPSLPRITLVIRADLVREVEVQPIEHDEPPIVGRRASRTYRVTLRHPSHRPTPTILARMIDPFEAKFVGSPVEHTLAAGIIEWRRDLTVAIPAQQSAETVRTPLRLESDDGRVWEETLSWQVLRDLRVAPEALTIGRDETSVERTILVRSTEREVTILRVDGEIVADHRLEPGTGASRDSKVVLHLDGGKAEIGNASVRIFTDHPLYPELEIPVVVIPR